MSVFVTLFVMSDTNLPRDRSGTPETDLLTFVVAYCRTPLTAHGIAVLAQSIYHITGFVETVKQATSTIYSRTTAVTFSAVVVIFSSHSYLAMTT
jgi:hypothetical protein